MSLGVPLHDALHEKQAPHSLCGACSLEVMVQSEASMHNDQVVAFDPVRIEKRP